MNMKIIDHSLFFKLWLGNKHKLYPIGGYKINMIYRKSLYMEGDKKLLEKLNPLLM